MKCLNNLGRHVMSSLYFINGLFPVFFLRFSSARRSFSARRFFVSSFSDSGLGGRIAGVGRLEDATADEASLFDRSAGGGRRACSSSVLRFKLFGGSVLGFTVDILPVEI